MDIGTLYATLGVKTAPLRQAEREVQSFTRKTESHFKTLAKYTASIFSIVAIKKVGSSFIEAARNIENYQIALGAVIKDAEKTKKVFQELNKWAAINPVDTDDAVQGFVRLKTAAVKNTMEAVQAAADLATVMGSTISGVAGAIVSTQVEVLRKLGIILDRTGKKTIIQSGQVKIAVEKDIEAVRAGIIKVIQMNFGGAMQEAANSWRGVTQTIGGMWSVFKQDVMGSAGTGGPFDALKMSIISIRDEWSKWMNTTDYTEFVQGIQNKLVGAFKLLSGTVKTVINHIDDLTYTIGILTASFVAMKTIAISMSIAHLLTEFTTFVSLAPLAIKSISNFTSWIGLLGVSLTPGGKILLGLAALVTVVMTIEKVFKNSAEEARVFREEIAKLPDTTNKIGGVVGGWKMGLKGAFTQENLQRNEMTYATLEAQRLATLKAAVSKDMVADEVIPTTKTSEGPSAAEKLVDSIRDKIKYLYADAKSFLPLLEAQKSKLVVLSQDWKTIHDLQVEIRNEMSKQVGIDTAQQLQLAEKRKKDALELAEVVKQGQQQFYTDMAWENQMGLMGDTEYLSLLTSAFERIKSTLADTSVANWTDEMKSLFESMQQLQISEVDKILENMSLQYEIGETNLQDYKTGLESLLSTYSEFPGVVKYIEDAIKGLETASKRTQKSLKGMIGAAEENMVKKIQELPEALSSSFASAIAYGDSLSGSLKKLAQDIAFATLKAMILKYIMGPISTAFGFSSGGGLSSLFGSAKGNIFNQTGLVPFANGGIVNQPTLFPFANGIGLMGEAGPEAIMPLKRTSSGELGVKAESRGNTTVNIYVTTPDADSFRRSERQILEIAKRAMQT